MHPGGPQPKKKAGAMWMSRASSAVRQTHLVQDGWEAGKEAGFGSATVMDYLGFKAYLPGIADSERWPGSSVFVTRREMPGVRSVRKDAAKVLLVEDKDQERLRGMCLFRVDFFFFFFFGGDGMGGGGVGGGGGL